MDCNLDYGAGTWKLPRLLPSLRNSDHLQIFCQILMSLRWMVGLKDGSAFIILVSVESPSDYIELLGYTVSVWYGDFKRV